MHYALDCLKCLSLDFSMYMDTYQSGQLGPYLPTDFSKDSEGTG